MPKAWMRRLRNRPGKPWVVFWEEDGHPRQQLGFRSDKDAAQQFLARKLADLGQSAPVADRNATVEDFAARWLRDAAPGLKRGTVKSYHKHVKLHIVPAIGKLR